MNLPVRSAGSRLLPTGIRKGNTAPMNATQPTGSEVAGMDEKEFEVEKLYYIYSDR